MGKALQGKRQQVVLMTKVCSHGRDKKVALQQQAIIAPVEANYLDLWQIHEVVYEDDPDLHFAPNGATEALLEAKQQGRCDSSASPATNIRRSISKCWDTTFRSMPARCR